MKLDLVDIGYIAVIFARGGANWNIYQKHPTPVESIRQIAA